MKASALPWRPLRFTTIAGNLLGAILTFFYFRVVDPESAATAGAVGIRDIAISVVAFGALVAIGYPLGRRWVLPLRGDGLAATSTLVRRRALQVPYIFACLTLAGWVLAGLIWGVLWPTVTSGVFDPRFSLRLFFGITGLAGSVATVFSFLAAEHYWRRAMPVFFPHGDVSDVSGALRLPVRLRLLGIFLLISVIPLTILGLLAYNRAEALLHADPARAAVIVGGLGPLILFIVAVGILAAIGLALFAANSVAAPLKRVEEAMAAVGRGELETGCPVIANDEIGAVAEGFNRMLGGLRERELRVAARGGHHTLRGSARLHAVGRADGAARRGPRPQRVLHGDGGGHPLRARARAAVHRGRDRGGVRSTPPRRRSCRPRPRRRPRDARPPRAPERAARGRGQATTQERHRHSHGHGARGEYRQRGAVELRPGRRRGQPRLAHPGAQQGTRHRDPGQRRHANPAPGRGRPGIASRGPGEGKVGRGQRLSRGVSSRVTSWPRASERAY